MARETSESGVRIWSGYRGNGNGADASKRFCGMERNRLNDVGGLWWQDPAPYKTAAPDGAAIVGVGLWAFANTQRYVSVC